MRLTDAEPACDSCEDDCEDCNDDCGCDCDDDDDFALGTRRAATFSTLARPEPRLPGRGDTDDTDTPCDIPARPRRPHACPSPADLDLECPRMPLSPRPRGDRYVPGRALAPRGAYTGGFCDALDEPEAAADPRVVEGPDGSVWLQLRPGQPDACTDVCPDDDEEPEEPEFNENVRPVIYTDHVGRLPGYSPLRDGDVFARDPSGVEARLPGRDEL
jgi:hypothetical protein